MNRRAQFVGGGIRILFIVVMAAAALPKISDPVGFALALGRHRMLPDAMIGLFAAILPWLELSAAAAAIFPGFWRGGLAVGAALLTGFAVVLAFNLAHGLTVPCGCFDMSAAAGPAGWAHVAANLVGAIVCGWTAGLRSDKKKTLWIL